MARYELRIKPPLARLLGLVLLSTLAACACQEPPTPPAVPAAATPAALAEPGQLAQPPGELAVPPAISTALAVQLESTPASDTPRALTETAPAAQGAQPEWRSAAEAGQSPASLAQVAPPPQAPPDSAPPAQVAAVASEAPAITAAPPLPPEPPIAGPRRTREAPPPAVSARYVAVLVEASGELLYGQDEHARVAPASVTKIATVLVALEREPDLARRIPITVSGSAMAARDHSSIMGLEPGQQVSLATLLHGMMLPSGNDAAEQVALALGGSREAYVAWMNAKVTDLGLQDTHFVNPSGMDAAGHYSSAYDMASLARVAMRNEAFRELAGAATYRGDGYSMANLNRLLGAYPGADGVKIGFTRAAGRTIVASATHDGHRVYVSLMRSQDLPGDSSALLDWVWRTFAW